MDWIVNEFVFFFLVFNLFNVIRITCVQCVFVFIRNIFCVICVCMYIEIVGGNFIVWWWYRYIILGKWIIVCVKRKNKNHSNSTSTLCLPFCLAHFHQFGLNFQFHHFPAIDCSIDYSLAVLQFDLEFPLLQNHCHFCQHQNQTARRCDCFHSFLVPKFHRRMFQRPRSLVIKRQNKNELNNRPNQSAHGWNERYGVDERDWFFNVHKKDKT